MEKQKIEKKIGIVTAVMAVISLIFTLSYGLGYYIESIHDPLLLIFTVIQNSIEAFAFRSGISFAELADKIHESTSVWYKIFAYLYGIACFIAPYCTLTFFYQIISRLINLRFRVERNKGDRRVIIFGYNSTVKKLLRLEEGIAARKGAVFAEGYRIHLVTSEEISTSEKAALQAKGVIIHNENFKTLTLDKKAMRRFLEDIEVTEAEKILLLEESASFDFSIYHYFCAEKDADLRLNDHVKFFLNCEDEGIFRIIQENHDKFLDEGKNIPDIEVFSIPELRVRDLMKTTPLHSVYLDSDKQPNEWDLHLIIIGWNLLGEQLALQALNMGVSGSRNRILIDILDEDAKNAKKRFESRFNPGYVTMEGREVSIGSDRADGECRIRFTKGNVRNASFIGKMKELSEDSPFTYGLVCLDDADDALYALSQFMRFIRQNPGSSEPAIPVVMQLDSDMALQRYAEECSDSEINVIALKPFEKTISLEDILSDNLNAAAKKFNHVYNMLHFSSSEEADRLSKENPEEPGQDAVNAEWQQLTLFKRNASLAIALHASVQTEVMKKSGITKEVLNNYFGEQGTLLRHEGTSWVYEGTAAEFAEKQSDTEVFAVPSELSRMEHRRWCYYTASCGWGCTEDKTSVKNQERLENPCMCTWDDLEKYQPESCVYDLMPTLYEMSDHRLS